jgi:hypothetical protein
MTAPGEFGDASMTSSSSSSSSRSFSLDDKDESESVFSFLTLFACPTLPFELLGMNGRNIGGNFNILPSQSKTIVSNSVHEGLAAQENPTIPKPAERISPKIDG